MLPARPELPSRPCPACGKDVDTLRAPRVVWMEDGVRFLCGEECRVRFLVGERDFDAPSQPPPQSPPAQRPSIPDMVREATLVRVETQEADDDPVGARRHDPLVAAGLALLALAVVTATPSRELGWIAAFLLTLCSAVNARTPLATLRASQALRAVAPLGLVLAVIAALLAPDADAQRWSLIGAAVAALAISSRSWVHASMFAPVRRGAMALRDTLPMRARIPAQDSLAYEDIPSARLRQGDLAVALEGERVPADGVIEEGDGVALRYPKATHSKPFVEGDFILAGTRVLEGALTLRVRRTGRERGIVRATDLARRSQRERVAASRLEYAIAHWSWLALVPAVIATFLWSGPAGAAALLLGFPVLALLASFDVPLDAGALASARRGMLFGGSGALRDAGRTGTTAILLRGALTAGAPMVQQVHRLGRTELRRSIALAAALEEAAEDHPIARAIRRHAEEEGYAKAAVRKERVHGGLGVTGVTARGVPVVVGRRQLLLDEGISVAAADSDAAHIENEGLTPIFIAIDGQVEALLAILDPTHVGARQAVQRIADLPSEVVILSGDDRRTVERIALQLGASQVKAPLLPQERVAEVRALRETGGVVAAIGRGGEDDAVLAAADVPVSLRLVGTSLEDRGIIVASQDVRDAAGAMWIARAARRSTWRSVGACVAMGALIASGAVLGWMTPVAAALLGLATEAWTVRAGSRLLRRVDLRVPMQQ